jgi:hypothetical protein
MGAWQHAQLLPQQSGQFVGFSRKGVDVPDTLRNVTRQLDLIAQQHRANRLFRHFALAARS